MAKAKRQKPERLVGIRAHKKRDLFEGCNEPGSRWFTPNPIEFQKAFCRICRNEECIRAQGATTPWHHRMENQMDNLFLNPHFSDLSTDAHKQLAGQLFNDLRQKAERLEIARQNQDWEIPEGPTDGFDRVAATQATDDVDAAIKALAEAKGNVAPELTKSDNSEKPSHFSPVESKPENDPGGDAPRQPGDPVGVEYETQYPKGDGDGNGTYRIMLLTNGLWSCECDGWRYKRKCRHMDDVRPWYEEHKNDDQKEAEPEPPPPAPREPPPPQQQPANYNTPMPRQGVMVGGGSGHAPGRNPSQVPAVHDPWSPRKDTVIQPGATVVMKSKKKP